MKKNQNGFSVVEVLLILVIVGILGFTGWYVWNASNNADKNLNAASSASSKNTAKKSIPKQSTTEATSYSFSQLGITMNVLSGWEVKNEPTTTDGTNFYKWTVQKSGADGKIVLSSSGFQGGFESCGPTKAIISDAEPTQNKDLMFLSWSFANSDGTQNRIGIVKSENLEFGPKASSEGLTDPIKNKFLTPGNYYFCLGDPNPGFFLKLNSEAAPGYTRSDSITALSNTGSDTKYVPLSQAAESYPDIKAMLISIR